MKVYTGLALFVCLLTLGCGREQDSKPASGITADRCLEGNYKVIKSAFFDNAYEVRPLPSHQLVDDICAQADDIEKIKLKPACEIADQHLPEYPPKPGEIPVDHAVHDQIWSEETALALVKKLNCP